MLKYYKRSNEYRNSTRSNFLCCDRMQAYSYIWWCYLKEVNGVWFFNNYSYSNSTSKHQSDMLSLLRQKYPQIYNKLVFVQISDGLQDKTFTDIWEKQIKNYTSRIQELKEEIARPRSHKRKNVERIESITYLADKVMKLKEKYNLEIDTKGLHYSNLHGILKVS